ncbi:hypothetical protein CRE_09052 [Caenorhabditis remanei]|uniref:G-protein coupled receptors family 1 profile domain-containing protein n=1 Tax=Caenorhabditis remanei TaxID=31234 RepID=E3LJ32_CAERE|nr:hypothetical protein CRE_09052 [Caenorhabditis remanei]
MSCTYRNNYFESDEFLELALHSLFVFEVPIHTLGVYIIVMKTPNEMGKTKFPMLLMHLTFALNDVYVAIFALPRHVFPICSGYSMGILLSIGVPIWIQRYIGLTLFFRKVLNSISFSQVFVVSFRTSSHCVFRKSVQLFGTFGLRYSLPQIQTSGSFFH